MPNVKCLDATPFLYPRERRGGLRSVGRDSVEPPSLAAAVSAADSGSARASRAGDGALAISFGQTELS
jgi:hypothetical protein